MQARGRTGWVVSATGQVGVLESDEGFRPPDTASVMLAPTWRVNPSVQVLAGADAAWAGADHWDGAPYGGRSRVAGTAGVIAGLAPNVVLQANVRVPVWQALTDHDHADPEGGSLEEGWLGSLGLTWTRRVER